MFLECVIICCTFSFFVVRYSTRNGGISMFYDETLMNLDNIVLDEEEV